MNPRQLLRRADQQNQAPRRIARPIGGAAAETPPFTVTTGSGLTANITGGKGYGVGATLGETLSAASVNLTASQDNYVYVVIPLDAAPSSASIPYYWEIDTATGLSFGAYITQKSLDETLPVDATGTAYLLLATVTTDTDSVTNIEQHWTGHFDLTTGIGHVIFTRRLA